MNRMRFTDIRDPITSNAFPLAALRGQEQLALGSSVLIGPNLLLTAKHVVKAPWTRWKQNTNPEWDNSILVRGSDAALNFFVAEFDFRIFAFQPLHEAQTVAVWLVHQMWITPFTDLAVLHIKPFGSVAEQVSWNPSAFPKLNVHGPNHGEEVAAFGYPKIEWTVSQDAVKDSIGFNVDIAAAWTYGHVLSNTPTYRGSPDGFPCFETNMQNHNQMSGGPVFQHTQELCGIIVGKAIDPEPLPENYSDFHAYSATLLPLMGMPMNAIPEQYGEARNFMRLVRNLGIDNRFSQPAERIAVHEKLLVLYQERIQSPEHSLIADTSLALAQDLCHAGRLEHSIPHYANALKIAEANGFTDNHPFVEEAKKGLRYATTNGAV